MTTLGKETALQKLQSLNMVLLYDLPVIASIIPSEHATIAVSIR